MIDFDLNYQNSIITDFYKKVTSEFAEKLKSYLKSNLLLLGYDFSNDEEFLNFCKQRVTRIGFDFNPHSFEFYLDYVDEENNGTLIGSYNDKMTVTQEGGKFTATIGTKFD